MATARNRLPRLGPVHQSGQTASGYPEFLQRVDETVVIQGQTLISGLSEWTSGVLYPDHLGIGFAERLADVPEFVAAVQQLSGRLVSSVQGIAAVAIPGDLSLLGDWIRAGTFDPARLARRFDTELGGRWVITLKLKQSTSPTAGYTVSIDREPGASP